MDAHEWGNSSCNLCSRDALVLSLLPLCVLPKVLHRPFVTHAPKHWPVQLSVYHGTNDVELYLCAHYLVPCALATLHTCPGSRNDKRQHLQRALDRGRKRE